MTFFSLKNLISASKKGNTKALVGVAEACYEGRGIPQNEEKGFRLSLIAAKMGNPIGHEQLGYQSVEKVKELPQIKWGTAEGLDVLANSINRADCHYFFAAKYGSTFSLAQLNLSVEKGRLSREAYELAERLCMEANERVKSEERELAQARLS